MDVTPLIPKGKQLIQRYGDGAFTVSGETYRGSVLVLPSQTLQWAASSIAELSENHFMPVWMAEPPVELLLIGCGKHTVTLEAGLRQKLRARGVSVETMDTGAACRTYNVLMAEERRVAAALFAV